MIGLPWGTGVPEFRCHRYFSSTYYVPGIGWTSHFHILWPLILTTALQADNNTEAKRSQIEREVVPVGMSDRGGFRPKCPDPWSYVFRKHPLKICM